MRKELKIGMFLAPVCFIIYMGTKALFAPGAHVTEDEHQDILNEFNYSDSNAGHPTPDLTFLMDDGSSLTPKKISDFKGKMTVVHIWATWCGPCQKEMPEFDKFARANNSKINFIGLSVDMNEKPEEAQKTVSKYLSDNGYKGFQNGLDHTVALSRAFKVIGVPTTIFIDKDGKEKGRINGVILWSDPKVQKVIDSLLA